MSTDSRKRVFVDPIVQGAIMRRAVLYWGACLLFVFLPLLIGRTLSQPDRLWLYLFTCVGITGVVYAGILGTLQAVLVSSLSGTIVLYQIVNFHHYVVDGLIWKARKAPLRHAPGPN